MSLANLIDGRAIAEQIHAETSQRIAFLKQRGVQPGLAFVRVGDDPASQVYVGMKERMSARLAIASVTHLLPEAASERDLLKLIAQLNADLKIHGILVQAPLPRHLNQANVHMAVLPQKDVDGFHPVNVGKLMLGDTTGFVPCTPAGVQELLVRSEVKIEGAQVQGDSQTIKDNRFLRKTRTKYQAKGKGFQIGSRQLRVGNSVISVTTVSLDEQADTVERLADDVALSIRSAVR